jgi:hypothetical protein
MLSAPTVERLSNRTGVFAAHVAHGAASKVCRDRFPCFFVDYVEQQTGTQPE